MVQVQDSFAIELLGITKYFGSTPANKGVSFQVRSGTIHGIVGENGAGKSTAMKILYGMVQPDSGQIFLNRKSTVFQSPLDAIRTGIGMVHQHFMLAGPLSALDNILVGAEPLLPGTGYLPYFLRPIHRKSALEKLNQLAYQYGLAVPWEEPVENLPVGIQQRIEILKLLYRNASFLILDEPTAVLTPQESEALFQNLKKLRNEGKTILIITHKLREVISHTDWVTVLRAGQVTGSYRTQATSAEELASCMIGRDLEFKIQVPQQLKLGSEVLSVHELCSKGIGGRRGLSNLKFSIHEGEIVGVAGVDGNGQSELISAILNPKNPQFRRSGKIKVLGHDVIRWNTSSIRALGVGVIPEDRHQQGLLLESSVCENFLLGFQDLSQYQQWGFILFQSLKKKTAQALETYDVKPRDISLQAQALSGGNQQKLIVAREFQNNPKLLIACQPTRGVDVGATEFIHRKIFQARSRGAGVLLISSELDEIFELSDRILVFYEGKIVAEFKRGECNETDLGLQMSGAAGRHD